MPYFELTTLFRGRHGRKELGAAMAGVAKDVLAAGGVVARIDAMGADGAGPRKLAYRMNKQGKVEHLGYYVQYGEMVEETCRRLRLNDEVMRHMIERKNVRHVERPVVQLDEKLPDETIPDSDPIAELKRFMREYEKEYPQGENIDLAARLRRSQEVGMPVLRNIRVNKSTSDSSSIAAKYLEMLNKDNEKKAEAESRRKAIKKEIKHKQDKASEEEYKRKQKNDYSVISSIGMEYDTVSGEADYSRVAGKTGFEVERKETAIEKADKALKRAKGKKVESSDKPLPFGPDAENI